MLLPIPRNNVNLSAEECLRVLTEMFSKPTSSKDVRAFENAFAEYVGVGHCIAFSSGSAALYHGLAHSALKAGDEIIVPEYEFTTVIETIRLLGLVPVFSDVSTTDGNLTLDSIRKVHSRNVKAVLVAHIHGNPAPIEPIRDWCKEQNLLLIEDCAHSAGATIGNRRTGSFGDFAVFSFGDGKNLVTCGGGMVATSDAILAGQLKRTAENLALPSRLQEIKRFFQTLTKTALSSRPGFALLLYPIGFLFQKWFGQNVIDRLFSRGPVHFRTVPGGYRLAMTDLSGRLGLSQLARIEQLNQRRRENGERIFQSLSDGPAKNAESSADPGSATGLNLAYASDDAEGLRRFLFQHGIDSRQDYLLYYDREHPSGRLSEHTIYLPNHPGINPGEALIIGRKTREFLSAKPQPPEI